MHSLTLTPRFYETDAFGHINNTVVAGSTGAVGREVIAALLRSEDCTRITALIRAGSEARAQSRLVQHSKLHVEAGSAGG